MDDATQALRRPGDASAALTRQATAGADLQKALAARGKARAAREEALGRVADATRAGDEARAANEAAQQRSAAASLRCRLVLLLASEALAGGHEVTAAVAGATATAAAVLQQSGRAAQRRWLGGAEPPSPRLTRAGVIAAVADVEKKLGEASSSSAAAATKKKGAAAAAGPPGGGSASAAGPSKAAAAAAAAPAAAGTAPAGAPAKAPPADQTRAWKAVLRMLGAAARCWDAHRVDAALLAFCAARDAAAAVSRREAGGRRAIAAFGELQSEAARLKAEAEAAAQDVLRLQARMRWSFPSFPFLSVLLRAVALSQLLVSFCHHNTRMFLRKQVSDCLVSCHCSLLTRVRSRLQTLPSPGTPRGPRTAAQPLWRQSARRRRPATPRRRLPSPRSGGWRSWPGWRRRRSSRRAGARGRPRRLRARLRELWRPPRAC